MIGAKNKTSAQECHSNPEQGRLNMPCTRNRIREILFQWNTIERLAFYSVVSNNAAHPLNWNKNSA